MPKQQTEAFVYCLCCQLNRTDPTKQNPITPICEQHLDDKRFARFPGNIVFPMIGTLADCLLFNSARRHLNFPRDGSVPMDILCQIPEQLRAHVLRFLAKDEGVLVGLRSEEHMLELLKSHSLLSQLVTHIEYSPPLSTADHKGFDFVVKLTPVLATALGLSHIKIQVKTLPNHFVYYVKEKLIPKMIEGKLKGSSHLPVIEEGLVIVSAGGGETTDAAIMSAIIHQLIFYSLKTGGEDKVQALIDGLDQIDLQIVKIYEGQIPLVLIRDYDPLIEYLEFLENLWQAQGIEGLAIYYENEIKDRGKSVVKNQRSTQSPAQPKLNRKKPEVAVDASREEKKRKNRTAVQGGVGRVRLPRERRGFVRPNPAQTAF